MSDTILLGRTVAGRTIRLRVEVSLSFPENDQRNNPFHLGTPVPVLPFLFRPSNSRETRGRNLSVESQFFAKPTANAPSRTIFRVIRTRPASRPYHQSDPEFYSA